MPREYVVDPVVGAVGQADLLEHGVDRRLRLAASEPVQPGRVAQVLAAGQVAVEADAVGEVADAALDLERATRRVEADDPGRALGRLGQAEEHQDGRRLARAVLTEQAEDLAGTDVEVEVVDGDELVVALRQAAGPDADRGFVGLAADSATGAAPSHVRPDRRLRRASARCARARAHRRPYVRKT